MDVFTFREELVAEYERCPEAPPRSVPKVSPAK